MVFIMKFMRKFKELLIKKDSIAIALATSLVFNGLFIMSISGNGNIIDEKEVQIEELTEEKNRQKTYIGTLEKDKEKLEEKVKQAQPWFDMSEEEQLKLEEEQKRLEEERLAKEKAEQEEKERLEEEQRQKEEQAREQERQRESQLEEVNSIVYSTITQGMGSGYSPNITVKGNQVDIDIIGYNLDFSGFSRGQLDILIGEYNIDTMQNQVTQEIKNIYTQSGFNMTVKLTMYDSNGTLIYSTQR